MMSSWENEAQALTTEEHRVFKRKKAIITGANGFVGSAVCNELLLQGYDIIAVVRGEQSDLSRIDDVKKIRVVYCDMDNYSRLPALIHDKDIDVMYHFAWEGSAGPLRGDEEVQLNNISNTCKLVYAAAEMNCKRFVFASSLMEYEVKAFMQTDKMPPINTIYSTSKITANYMARAIAGKLGVAYISAIISNVYGVGEKSPRFVNTSIRKMLKGERCAFSPGEQTYDFIYITDAAKAFCAVGAQGNANKTYYIGSLSPKPLKEFIYEMRDAIDPRIDIGLGEIPFDGVSLSYKEFDIHAVRDDTGLVPEVSFAEGVRRTSAWIAAGEKNSVGSL